jgi:hypothetical protein
LKQKEEKNMSSADTIGSSLFLLSAGIVWTWLQMKKDCKVKRVVKISQLNIYPIKSCDGIQVESSFVTKRGLQYDRDFMVVDEKGVFVSQRKRPTMALIRTKIDAFRGVLCISAPDMPDLEVPLKESVTESSMEVIVWDDKCQAKVVETNDWFSTYLKTPNLKLVRFADNFVRPTDPEYAPQGQTGFADGFPFLLASEASIQNMNKRVNFQISMKRFRPSIVVDGCSAFEEDSWRDFEFRSQPPMTAKVVKPCARCSIPDVDPETAIYDKEMKVSRLMRTFRTGENLSLGKEKWNKQLFFGQNVDHAAQENIILSIGDELVFP